MTVKIDFDVTNDFPQLDEVESQIENYGGTVLKVRSEGPGGGNPNFVASFPTRDQARDFLMALYEDPNYDEWYLNIVE